MQEEQNHGQRLNESAQNGMVVSGVGHCVKSFTHFASRKEAGFVLHRSRGLICAPLSRFAFGARYNNLSPQ
jgi:hypothetical protein